MHIFTSQSNNHRPPHEIFNGEQTPHQEVPARVETILSAIRQADFEVSTVADQNVASEQELLSILQSIHSDAYIRFLQSTQEMESDYLYPSVFNYRPELGEPAHMVAKRGYFSFDLYTPINNTTYQAALNSAQLAQTTAQHVLLTQGVAYGLCRPPGHHAEHEKMGGYCYFNNGGVAARVLQNGLAESENNRVAILDVDFHHGNGAEQIFSQDENILTVSIHADPKNMFPYFSGYKETEYQANLNYPLSLGSTNEQYQLVLQQALDEISIFNPGALVVCFGADTHTDDPIGGFKLTTEYFTKMAQTINQFKLPTVILQEGGYNTELLGMNVVSFLNGFSR